MKKIVLASAITAICCLILFACGAGSPEVSAEMKDFMSVVSSTKSIVTGAEKYSYQADEIPLEYYELAEPQVKKIEKQGTQISYLVNFKHGLVDSDIIINWEKDKIVSIKDVE